MNRPISRCMKTHGMWKTYVSSVLFCFHCTKMYPMALMCLLPLSASYSASASFPHVLESSGYPPVPNPILESQDSHSFSLLKRIPILALLSFSRSLLVLNPSLLQLNCLARRPQNQSATSTFHDQVRCCGISHQRSKSTRSSPACW